MGTIKSNNVEVWKPVKDWEKLYEVSNYGNVRSLARKTTKGKLLKPELQNGYLKVMLSNGDIKKWYSIHRLVAIAFIENKNNKEQVNHIDGNKINNREDNLEWVTCKENINHSIKNGLKITKKGGEHKLSKKVNQYDYYGNLIKTWESINDIYRDLKISKGNISNCCNYKRNSAGGYIWRYVNE